MKSTHTNRSYCEETSKRPHSPITHPTIPHSRSCATQHHLPMKESNPHRPAYMPKNSPLYHWILRLLPSAHSHLKEVIIKSTDTSHSNYRALTTYIPQIGDITKHSTPTQPNIPTTRDRPTISSPHPQTTYRTLPARYHNHTKSSQGGL